MPEGESASNGQHIPFHSLETGPPCCEARKRPLPRLRRYSCRRSLKPTIPLAIEVGLTDLRPFGGRNEYAPLPERSERVDALGLAAVRQVDDAAVAPPAGGNQEPLGVAMVLPVVGNTGLVLRV